MRLLGRDQLVDLVGELVTVQARLSEKAGRQTDADLVSIAEEVETLTSGLRDNAMSIRMLQIGTTFSSLKRLVRDLSQSLGGIKSDFFPARFGKTGKIRDGNFPKTAQKNSYPVPDIFIVTFCIRFQFLDDTLSQFYKTVHDFI